MRKTKKRKTHFWGFCKEMLYLFRKPLIFIAAYFFIVCFFTSPPVPIQNFLLGIFNKFPVVADIYVGLRLILTFPLMIIVLAVFGYFLIAWAFH